MIETPIEPCPPDIELTPIKPRSLHGTKRIKITEILGMAIPQYTENKDVKEIKLEFSEKYSDIPEVQKDYYVGYETTLLDNLYEISKMFLTTGYLLLGRVFKNYRQLHAFEEIVEWDITDKEGYIMCLFDIFGNYLDEFALIAELRFYSSLETIKFVESLDTYPNTEQKSRFKLSKIQVEESSAEVIDNLIERLPDWAVRDEFVNMDFLVFETSLFDSSDCDTKTVRIDEIMYEKDLESPEWMFLLHQVRHMLDGCFAGCPWIDCFNFYDFFHSVYENTDSNYYNNSCRGLSLNNFFYGCGTLGEVSGTLPYPIDTSYMFYGCISLEEVNMNFLPLEAFNSISYGRNTITFPTLLYAQAMFANCINLRSFEPEAIYWGDIYAAQAMFENCLSLKFVNATYLHFIDDLVKHKNKGIYHNLYDYAGTISDDRHMDILISRFVRIPVQVLSYTKGDSAISVNTLVSLAELFTASHSSTSQVGVLYGRRQPYYQGYDMHSTKPYALEDISGVVTNRPQVEFIGPFDYMFRNCINLELIHFDNDSLLIQFSEIRPKSKNIFEGCILLHTFTSQLPFYDNAAMNIFGCPIPRENSLQLSETILNNFVDKESILKTWIQLLSSSISLFVHHYCDASVTGEEKFWPKYSYYPDSFYDLFKDLLPLSISTNKDFEILSEFSFWNHFREESYDPYEIDIFMDRFLLFEEMRSLVKLFNAYANCWNGSQIYNVWARMKKYLYSQVKKYRY